MSAAKKIASKIAASVAVLGISAIATMGVTGTAQAQDSNFKLCNWGSNYDVQAQFGGSGFATFIAFPGQCVETSTRPGEAYHINVYQGGNYQFSTTMKTANWSGRTLAETWGSRNDFHSGQTSW